MALSFESFIDQSNRRLDQLKKESKFNEFSKTLQALYPSSESLFQGELEKTLLESKIPQFLDRIRKKNKEGLLSISGFDVRRDGTVLIRDELGTRVSSIVDLNWVASSLVPEEKKNIIYLVLSLFSMQANFIDLQLYFALNSDFSKKT
jgi:hypothetical protein